MHDACSASTSPPPVYILYPEAADTALFGGKAAALARLSQADLPIPGWFVISPEALRASLTVQQQTALAEAQDSLGAMEVLANVVLEEAVEEQLAAAVAELSLAGEKLAVRSSALYEDSAAHSFAGQLESFLDVAPAEVAEHVRAVWRSGYSPRIYAYRRQHGLSGVPDAPAVLVQRMAPSEAGGVAFSSDPVSGRRQIAVIAAVRGSGEALVAGERNADTLRVAYTGEIVERQFDNPRQPVLTDVQACRVAELARDAARVFGRPQDIEWAICGDRLYLLQSRPITSLANVADPDGNYVLWDNSNIIESYGGMTTPLTYSFARRAYAEVYQEFCRILRVPTTTIQSNQAVFSNMIGLIQGRIYYNLLNWYRVLAMLPGFKANRGFMEQMMGVKESLPDEVAAALEASTWRQRMADRWHFAVTVLGLITNYVTLEGRKRKFYMRLTGALGKGRPDLSGLRADELVAYYRQLDGQLLHHWDAPLINDFFAMIFYGLLRSLTKKWCGDMAGTLQNDLLTGEGGMISAEPAKLVRDLAQHANEADADRPGFSALLRNGSRLEIERAMSDLPAFSSLYQVYLERFGDRCMNELKLESPTLHDDPLPLLRAVGQLAKFGVPDQTATVTPRDQSSPRHLAEKQVASALSGKPVHRLLFHWVLKNARRRVRDRENLRFERTRVFGRARQILRELGRRFYAVDRLDDPHAVFYLNLDEILGFVEGTTTCTDLRGLAMLRQMEFGRYAHLPTPVERFSTNGMVHQGNVFSPVEASRFVGEDVAPGELLQGIGCCPGAVRGRVRVVVDPLSAQLEKGDIIVAEHTDPSWIMILPLASGLLVERGSLLSHAAIVSRELSIPSVVALPGITQWLRTGDTVAFDGSTGVVHKVPDDAAR